MKKRKRLRILIIDGDISVSPESPTPSRDLAVNLARLGHKVTLITPQSSHTTTEIIKNVTFINAGTAGSSRILNKIYYTLKLPVYLRKIRYDIVLEYFTHRSVMSMVPLFAKSKTVGLPTVGSSQTPQGLGAGFYPLEQIRLRLYSAHIAYTDDIATMIKHNNPKALVKIIPMGIGKEYLTISQSKPEFILYLGHLQMGKKGIDLLLSAYAKVQKNIRYPLVIAGHGPDEAKIRRQIKKLHLTKKVIMLGPTYGDKKHSVLSKALFLAYPVRTDDMPIVPLEALASGVPIVSFDIPALSWLEEPQALKAVPYEVTDYARLLRFAATSKSIGEMRIQARKAVRKLTREKLASQYESFFLKVLEN